MSYRVHREKNLAENNTAIPSQAVTIIHSIRLQAATTEKAWTAKKKVNGHHQMRSKGHGHYVG